MIMNAKAYFLRLDIFRTISRVLLVVFILLAYGMRSVSPGVAGIVTVVVGLIVFGIGSVLRVSQAGEITDLISKERCILETEILNKNFRDGSPVCIHAYGNAHQRFARTAHGRLIYPTCLNSFRCCRCRFGDGEQCFVICHRMESDWMRFRHFSVIYTVFFKLARNTL